MSTGKPDGNGLSLSGCAAVIAAVAALITAVATLIGALGGGPALLSGLRVFAGSEDPSQESASLSEAQSSADPTQSTSASESTSFPSEPEETVSMDAIETVPLISEKGLEEDYRKLRQLLKEGQWEEANQTTMLLMLEAGGSNSEIGFLSTTQMKVFPCDDILTIERLWASASGGKFGFKAQYTI